LHSLHLYHLSFMHGWTSACLNDDVSAHLYCQAISCLPSSLLRNQSLGLRLSVSNTGDSVMPQADVVDNACKLWTTRWGSQRVRSHCHLRFRYLPAHTYAVASPLGACALRIITRAPSAALCSWSLSLTWGSDVLAHVYFVPFTCSLTLCSGFYIRHVGLRAMSYRFMFGCITTCSSVCL
jgi:hypothetical protein